MLSQLQCVYPVIIMHITTFGRSLVVLRTLFIVQPQPAWMPAELQTAMDADFATVAEAEIFFSESLEQPASYNGADMHNYNRIYT